jgi:hypothetical protein
MQKLSKILKLFRSANRSAGVVSMLKRCSR